LEHAGPTREWRKPFHAGVYVQRPGIHVIRRWPKKATKRPPASVAQVALLAIALLLRLRDA
jgi:hypothetical protein